MRRFALALGCVVAVLVAIQAGVGLADTLTLNAAQDLYIRDAAKDSANDNDGVSVRSKGGVAIDNRNGTLTFDLSGVTDTITDAYLRQYAVGTANANSLAYAQSASLLWKTADGAHDVSGITWNKVHGTSPSYSKSSLDTLGDMSLAANSAHPAWYSTSSASASDLGLLNSLRTSGDKKISLLLNDGGGWRDWADAEQGFACQLVVTTATIPEPATGILTLVGVTGLLAYAWRKRK